MLLPRTPPYEECREVYLTTLPINYHHYHLYLSKYMKYPCISVAAYLLQCCRVLYPLLYSSSMLCAVVGKFCCREILYLVVLFIIDKASKVLFQCLIYSFSLAISLRVI